MKGKKTALGCGILLTVALFVLLVLGLIGSFMGDDDAAEVAGEQEVSTASPSPSPTPTRSNRVAAGAPHPTDRPALNLKESSKDKEKDEEKQKERKREKERTKKAAEPKPPVPPARDCDPNYSGCVPLYPPDVDCSDILGPVRVVGSDPHRLDADGDGVGCEA